MPESKPNPCVVCGNQPSVGDWNGDGHYTHAAYCYNDLDTHAIQCNGFGVAQAVERWNRLNPLPGSAPVARRRFSLRALLGRLA